MDIITEIEKEFLPKDLPPVKPGDEVSLHWKIKEGDKERVQVFTGTVLGIRGKGTGRTITIRKVSHGEGVERVIPLCSPLIQKLTVLKPGKTSRAKLYYLRNRKN